MPLDIHWTFTAHVPELEVLNQTLLTIGGQMVDAIQGIKDTLVRIEESQAAAAENLASQVTVIANEVSQWNKESVTPEQVTNLQNKLTEIATTAEQQAAQIRANSEQIAGIVPDQPAPPTPPA